MSRAVPILRFAADVTEAIRCCHPELKRRLRSALEVIRQNPDAGKMLTGELAGWWTYRVGTVRIVYRAAGKMVEIAAIGPRASIYRDATDRVRRTRPGAGAAKNTTSKKGPSK